MYGAGSVIKYLCMRASMCVNVHRCVGASGYELGQVHRCDCQHVDVCMGESEYVCVRV